VVGINNFNYLGNGLPFPYLKENEKLSERWGFLKYDRFDLSEKLKAVKKTGLEQIKHLRPNQG
jgi:hypothetical protein